MATAAMRQTPPATPTPIPALAPVERPEEVVFGAMVGDVVLLDGEDVGVAVGKDVSGAAVEEVPADALGTLLAAGFVAGAGSRPGRIRTAEDG